MPQIQIDAARRIAFAIRKAETSIDRALIDAARLSGIIPTERLKAELAAEFGNSAIQAAVESSAFLAQARTRMVQAHKTLAQVANRLGLDPVAFDGLWGKPPMPKAELRVVAGTQSV